MQTLQSTLENHETIMGPVKQELEELGFTLGGNWDYDHGYFDYAMDEANKVFLRLPFNVTAGSLDSEADGERTKLKFGTPFVLKHLYNEGLDGEATIGVARFVIDQFQSPVNSDADLAGYEVDQAKQVLRKVEERLLQ
ncbi:YugN family protein [Paenibacillus turpanensis]|uniref:YugN family protein n=1 Tax=Paenibacillus turpanensis TaxID=2689078 RepID=UPI00140949BC|nr:YugN family protein [Paenibacillus turpanensis]